MYLIVNITLTTNIDWITKNFSKRDFESTFATK